QDQAQKPQPRSFDHRIDCVQYCIFWHSPHEEKSMKGIGSYKIFFLLGCIALFTAACHKKSELKRPTSDDFESLTGKDLPVWEYVQTKEDYEHLNLFKSL